jgi:WD40 repeat protein
VLAAVTGGGTVVVLDAQSGQEIAGPFRAPARAMTVALRDDGGQVAFGTDGGTVHVYDTATGGDVVPAIAAGAQRAIAVFGPGPDELTVAGSGGPVQTVSLLDGSIRPSTNASLQGSVYSLAVDGARVAVGFNGGGSILTEGPLVLHSPIGLPLGTSGSVVEIGTAVTATPTEAPGGAVVGTASSITTDVGPLVSFVDDGAAVAVADGSGLALVPTTPGVEETRLDAPVGAVQDMSISADGSTLVVVGTDATAVWSLDGDESFLAAVHGDGPSSTGQLSPDGRRLVITTGVQSSQVLDVATGEAITTPFDGFARFAEDDTLVAGTGAPALNLRRVDATDGSTIGEPVPLGEFAPIAFAASPARDRLALAGPNGEVRLGREAPDGGILLETIVGPEVGAIVRGLTFTADGAGVIVVGTDGIRIVDVVSGEVVGEPDVPGAMTAAVSPDGELLAIGTVDGAVALLDATTFEPTGRALEGHVDNVVEVAFRPDGGVFASLGRDGTIRLWDVDGRRLLGSPLPAADADLLPVVAGGALAFSQDGRILTAPAVRGGVALWSVDPEAWVAEACRIAGRDLTEAEWTAYLPPDTPYRRTCTTT